MTRAEAIQKVAAVLNDEYHEFDALTVSKKILLALDGALVLESTIANFEATLTSVSHGSIG